MSKVFQIVAIVFYVLSCSLLVLRFSNFLKDYPNLNSELKPLGISLVFLGTGFLAVAKRMKSKESKTV